jgi:acylphosphatase
MKRTLLAALSVLALVASPALACGAAKAGQVAGCPMGMKGVEKTAQNLDNGVKVTFVAKDAEKVKALQAAMASEIKGEGGCKDCPMHATGVKADVENTSNGMVLTLTSGDASQVQQLQKYAASGCAKGGCAHGAEKANKGDCPHAATQMASRT